MNTNKKCCRCQEYKTRSAFSMNVARKDGLQDTCKSCVKRLTRKGYQTREMTYSTRARYMEAWARFFEQEYGMDPKCQICGTALAYRKDDPLQTVRFDHRYGDESPIHDCPSRFCRTHPCTEEHIATWRLCDFGILCHKCNVALPTRNRTDWLDNVSAYIGVRV